MDTNKDSFKMHTEQNMIRFSSFRQPMKVKKVSNKIDDWEVVSKDEFNTLNFLIKHPRSRGNSI